MKFAFVHAEKAYFPIAALCRLLGVSRQGYYAYATRPPSARTIADQQLGAHVQQLFKASEERYGSPRILGATARPSSTCFRARSSAGRWAPRCRRHSPWPRSTWPSAGAVPARA